jgi:TonB-dependent SusC/RagA subfamily outer membrane receptor
LLLFLLVGFPGLAQQKSFTGTINDKNGNPVAEALVLIKNQPLVKVFSDNEGKFSIIGQPGQILEVTTKDNRYKSIVLGAEQIALTVDSYDDLIPLGHGLEQPKGEITSAIGFVKADELTRSSVYNPANSLYGRIPGLTVLQNGGTSWNNEPDIFIRGVETFGIGSFVNTQILVLIDGFEGRLSSLLLTEIENVTILKDAAALAIYGLRGANGVMLVSTKKGSGKGLSVNLNYEHGITEAFRIPTFLDSYEYAKIYNQARVNDGLDPYYLPAELERFQSGNSPYLYPNVNWINECLRNYGTTDNVSVSFQEAANTIKYFGVINFYDEEGLLGPVHALEMRR